VTFQHPTGIISRHILAEGPFIDNTVVSRTIKNGRGDPRLKYKPAAEVDTANLLAALGESKIEAENRTSDGEAKNGRQEYVQTRGMHIP